MCRVVPPCEVGAPEERGFGARAVGSVFAWAVWMVWRWLAVVVTLAGCAGATDEEPRCVEQPLTWGTVGDHAPQSFVSSLAPCAAFTHERKPYLVAADPLSCTQELGSECAGHSSSDVVAALADHDVAASLKAASVVYGHDGRAVDQGIFEIVVGSATIDVGTDCGDEPECVSPPAGVQRLASLLRAVTTEQLKCGSCLAAFGEADK